VKRLRRQALLLVVAIQYLTRLPTPQLTGFRADWPVRATRYFPLVGQLVGMLAALVWIGAGRLWGAPVAAVLAVAAAVLATGGLHEDGLADTADGLGGGRTREERLQIMKDSRIGSFGALAMVVTLGLRATALAALPPWPGALALVASHGAGRAAAVTIMRLTPYAGEISRAKGRAADLRPTAAEALFAVAWGIIPLFVALPWRPALVAATLACLAAATLATASRRLIGGHTGDVLGAVEQAVEAAVLLAASARL
jgi:adenosylcobinamide-GDP ribazoletransferase